MVFQMRDFTVLDFEAAMRLWQADGSMGLSSADSREHIAAFLERNPRLSKVISVDERLVGTLLCGHDGRRGYLYHLYVDPRFRRRGAGADLVEACLSELRKEGIEKCHLFVFQKNDLGKTFWKETGWHQRTDIEVFSAET